MDNLNNYIESGILELYVLGMTSPEEAEEIEKLADLHPEIKKEINEISDSLEILSKKNAIEPHESSKPFIMASIDYTERLIEGESLNFPPSLNKDSKIKDYASWLDRNDMTAPTKNDNIYAKLIGHSPTETTAIVWIKSNAPHEVHHHEHEKFLIVEGTCEITIGDEIFRLSAGDFMSIPLHKGHSLVVTSDIPCKVILQRSAA